MITFACVYKTGKIYTTEYVRRLASDVARWFPAYHTFRVLTDDLAGLSDWWSHPAREGCQAKELILLQHGWPGYWSKIELFRKEVFDTIEGETVVYLDLDTIVRDYIHLFLLIDTTRFIMLRDWLAPDHFNSSVMIWKAGQYHRIYDRFRAHADKFMKEYRRYPEAWGDQSFIVDHLENRPIAIQDQFPGRFVSYKVSEVEERKRAAVVCFHGNPRPHEVNWSPL